MQKDSQRNAGKITHYYEHYVLARDICACFPAVETHDLQSRDLSDTFCDINVIQIEENDKCEKSSTHSNKHNDVIHTFHRISEALP